jgi:hypothetical protein
MSNLLRSYRRYFGLLLLLCALGTRAQQFNKEGLFEPKSGNSGLYDPKKQVGYDDAKLDKAGLDKLKAKLLPKMQATLDYMNGDKAHVKQVYDLLFGTGFYDQYLAELKSLVAYLKGTQAAAVTTLLPSSAQLEALLGQAQFEVPVKDAGSSTINLQSYKLPKKDLLAGLLLDRYNTTAGGDAIAARSMDDNYLREWQALEKMLADLQAIEAEAIKLKADPLLLRDVQLKTLEDRLALIAPQNTSLTRDIQGSKLLREWLWYSAGLPGMNPLGAAKPDRNYPLAETNTYFTGAKQKAQDELNSSGLLDAFAATKVTYNSLSLLVANPKDDKKYMLAEYDAAQNDPDNTAYFKQFSMPPDILANKVSLKLTIYNVPADQKVVLTPAQGDLAYESPAITAARGIFGEFLLFQTMMTTNLATFGKLEPLLNPTVLAPGQPHFQSPGDVAALSHSTGGALSYVQGAVHSLKIGNILVSLSGDRDYDKWQLIYAWFKDKGLDVADPEFRRELDDFIKTDRVIVLNNSSIASFQADVKALMARFDEYLKKLHDQVERLNRILSDVGEKRTVADAYVRITNRSLPLPKIEAKSGKTVMLRTFVYTFKMPAAPSLLSYSVTETGPAKEDEAKEVASGSFKVIETQHFDFSVGLSYTFADYAVTSDATPPATKIGDQFQFTGGAHIYPFGNLNKLGKGWGPPKDRFSVYLGLSLTHPLDHYFTGFAYDITPGIRPTIGWHWYKNFRYQVLNGAVIDKASGIAPAGFFVSINLEPAAFIKNITSSK